MTPQGIRARVKRIKEVIAEFNEELEQIKKDCTHVNTNKTLREYDLAPGSRVKVKYWKYECLDCEKCWTEEIND